MATLGVGLLNAVVVGSSATTVISSVGTNLIIGTITTTTSSIAGMIKYLASSNQPGISEIINMLSEIDLEFTINIIQQVVKEQNDKPLNESVKHALLGVSEILEKINKELDSIKGAIEYHNTKYFNGWRSFSWNGNMLILKNHNEILKHRYNLLFELLKIYNKTN
ncbi:hypothetical protein QKU48_gp0620 [Fadolivirus algeromassiliense]|jgi:ERCC4-type nuclease|uniref:Uncharacterized protein n=1 Tax=Fadolivirus FV1/VV64 TaxID=3070911 RepID=A0A7D3R1U8_9VIRU|nr:hypothetical protein QKU48_gp0620 [Fadolivirus algeromassiliense]QKF94078.1 hypothetical protein Fadolivirus_1_620 [Fadolivirus FV1/VV64]